MKNFMTGKHWIIIIIILISGISIFEGVIGFRKSGNKVEQWTSEDREILVGKCIKESGRNGLLYPDLTRSYCECSNDKIMLKFSKSEYLMIIKETTEEQLKILYPVFQDCFSVYQDSIRQLKK
jgi:hypothetical protein